MNTVDGELPGPQDSELLDEAKALLGHHRIRLVTTRDSKLISILGLCERHRGYDGGVVIGVLVQPECCWGCWMEWESKL